MFENISGVFGFFWCCGKKLLNLVTPAALQKLESQRFFEDFKDFLDF
jgi:hypothetical protein